MASLQIKSQTEIYDLDNFIQVEFVGIGRNQPKREVVAPNIQLSLEKDEAILLLYAADDPDGTIMMINTISRSGPSISTQRWEFNNTDTARESARWKRALEMLEHYGYVEVTGNKREIFKVTDAGYRMADQIREKWNIDTRKNPDEYL